MIIIKHDAADKCQKIIRSFAPVWLEEMPLQADAGRRSSGKTCIVHQSAYNTHQHRGAFAIFIACAEDDSDTGWIVFSLLQVRDKREFDDAVNQIIHEMQIIAASASP